MIPSFAMKHIRGDVRLAVVEMEGETWNRIFPNRVSANAQWLDKYLIGGTAL
jgi:hypothetical protein